MPIVAAFAAAAFFQAARALANAALSVDADADGAAVDAELAGAVLAVLGGAVEADAAAVAVAVCRVLGAAAGALDPAELQAATVMIVASNTPVNGRNRSLFTSLMTREPGVRLGLTAREHRERLRHAGNVGSMAMPHDSDWSWLRAAAEAPDMTIDVYESLPGDLARQIEVSDGTIIVCHSPTDKHQAVQHALLNALGEAARKHDQRKGTCHRVRADIDVLLTDLPFHFRRPDLSVFRCLDDSRKGRWQGKPIASDVVIAVEIVSPHTVSDDLLVKRVRYARAGIEHYWIVRLAQNDGPAISVEQLRLTSDGSYATEHVSFRKKDPLAVDAIDPFEIAISWDMLDEWL